MTDVVFVPAAEDGSAFCPDLRRDGKYPVVTEEGERAFDDFWEALQALQVAVSPTWRRPGIKGRWGLVKGVSWKRMDRKELVEMDRGSQ